MSTIGRISAFSTIARTRAIDHPDRRLYLEFRNGLIAAVDVEDSSEFTEGCVVLVGEKDDYAEIAPDELWPEESSVGIIHQVKEEKTVVSIGGQLRIIPNVAFRRTAHWKRFPST